MATRVKIKIDDKSSLREELDAICEEKTQAQLAQWALQLAKHILVLFDYNIASDEIIQNGFSVNEAWQKGEARMYDVRQAGFKVHQLAKDCSDKGIQAAFRVAGQAIGTGHMREHAMVASDYAVKAINIKFPNDKEAVTRERYWQIETLRK
jgi:hypothetical protein